MKTLVYTKNFVGGNLDGLTFVTRIPLSSDQRIAEAHAAVESGKLFDDLFGSSRFYLTDVRAIDAQEAA